MIRTKISQCSGPYTRAWYVYYAHVEEVLAEQGFAPRDQDWRLAGHSRNRAGAVRLAKKVHARETALQEYRQEALKA